MSNNFNDDLILKDALQIYFSKYHFENGGYHLKWFKIKVGAVFIPLPNIKARVDAVKIHDIHHILTEYKATLKGEAEIGAWEIASGCGRYYVAWLLNFGSFFYGLFFFPKALLHAFLKGRQVLKNLYYNTPYDEKLLNKKVGDLRDIVGVNIFKKIVLTDYTIFTLYSLLVLIAAFIFFFTCYTLVKLTINSF